MTSEATSTDTGWPAPPQPLLFDSASLPETPSRRPARRRRSAAAVAEGVVMDAIREAPPVPFALPPAPPPRPVVVVEREPFDPAALTNPEIRALAQALPDARLAHLIAEAAREIKRRLVPGTDDADEDGANDPNPVLLRAARQAVGELSGDDL
jgi:hypothetical protein